MNKQTKKILFIGLGVAAVYLIWKSTKKSNKSAFGGDRVAFNRNTGYMMPTGKIKSEKQEFEPLN
jgi:hypothetical protein